MADSTKYMPINGRPLFSDLKLNHIFSFKTRKTRAFAYLFISIFIGVTFFLAFNPSPDPSSPWFYNIFTSTTPQANGTTRNPSSTAIASARSHFSSIYSYFFPSNSSQSLQNSTVSSSPSFNGGLPRSQTTNLDVPKAIKDPPIAQNHTDSKQSTESVPNLASETPESAPINATENGVKSSSKLVPNLAPETPKSAPINATENGAKPSSNLVPNLASNPPEDSNQSTKSVPDLASETPKSAPINATENGVKPTSKLVPNLASETPKDSNQSTKSVPNLAPETPKSAPISATENGVKPSSKPQESVPKSLENGTESGSGERIEKKQGIEDLVKNLVNCNLFDGEWVRDESYPLYKPGSCSLIDEQFNCVSNGRPDLGFQMFKWKPKGCILPRLDGSKMLNLLRGKRLVFVGDSLNRNMWESLVCILRNSVKDQTKVYEASGRHHFRSEASYSFVFKDYDCTVEFFVAPFLVQEWETKDKNGTQKETLRLDLISSSADQYKTAEIVVFNTGHWWTHDKTAKGQDYYQEGSHVYKELNVLEAFRKAMTTWGRWVDANINPRKTSVFFRGYSASHFSGGQWNSGGACDHEIEPIKNTTYLTPYPDKMTALEKVFKEMKTRVSYLNVTRLTDFRKDGHPSVYRKQHYTAEEIKSPLYFQDCSHWCLPGVPDAWNEILYAELLVKEYQNQ